MKGLVYQTEAQHRRAKDNEEGPAPFLEIRPGSSRVESVPQAPLQEDKVNGDPQENYREHTEIPPRAERKGGVPHERSKAHPSLEKFKVDEAAPQQKKRPQEPRPQQKQDQSEESPLRGLVPKENLFPELFHGKPPSF
ncbi:MAG: hypothetical protein J6331_10595, partial [Lentisphaeria bacterium]|nr:hypothetical protein [Lentisphaeria bacterium]